MIIDIKAVRQAQCSSSLMIGSDSICIAVSGNYAYVVDNGFRRPKGFRLGFARPLSNSSYDPGAIALLRKAGK